MTVESMNPKAEDEEGEVGGTFTLVANDVEFEGAVGDEVAVINPKTEVGEPSLLLLFGVCGLEIVAKRLVGVSVGSFRKHGATLAASKILVELVATFLLTEVVVGLDFLAV